MILKYITFVLTFYLTGLGPGMGGAGLTAGGLGGAGLGGAGLGASGLGGAGLGPPGMVTSGGFLSTMSPYYGSYQDASVPFPRTSGARFCSSGNFLPELHSNVCQTCNIHSID